MVVLVLYALRANINLFYPPAAVLRGEVPLGKRVRLGGMVQAGSLRSDAAGLGLGFVVVDEDGLSQVSVRYSGLLPDLFAEGQGMVATGILNAEGIFVADYLLAKHDENYTPPAMRQSAEVVP